MSMQLGPHTDRQDIKRQSTVRRPVCGDSSPTIVLLMSHTVKMATHYIQYDCTDTHILIEYVALYQ